MDTPKTDELRGKLAAADGEIAALKDALAKYTDEIGRLKGDIPRLHRLVEAARREAAAVNELSDLRGRELAELRAALEDPQRLHAHILRTLNEEQIAHLLGNHTQELREALRKAIVWGEGISGRITKDRASINWRYLEEAREVLRGKLPTPTASGSIARTNSSSEPHP
jgi:chromosome segregation ATPase